jgi:hypothetical protein
LQLSTELNSPDHVHHKPFTFLENILATTFVPLSASLIDEGAFLENVNKELESLQRSLVAFVKEHGDKAHKASASLGISIELKLQNVESEAYSITTSMKSSIPKRPASVSLAIGGEGEDGQATLFVRQEGSDETTPIQGKLFKTHGQG